MSTTPGQGAAYAPVWTLPPAQKCRPCNQVFRWCVRARTAWTTGSDGGAGLNGGVDRRALIAGCTLVGLAVGVLLWWLLSDGEGVLPPAGELSALPGAAAAASPGGPLVVDGDGRDADVATGRTAERSFADPLDPYADVRTGYRGRVVAPSGAPVGGIDVRLVRGALELALAEGLDVFARVPAAPALVAATARTAQDGRFELLDVLPDGLCFLRCDFPDLQAAPVALRSGQGTIVPVQRTPAPGEIVDLGDVRLKAGAVLTGRVLGDDDRPVAGALVRAAILPPLPFAAVPIERLRPDGAIVVTAGGRSGVLELPEWVGAALPLLPIAATTSGADGAFTLHGVDPGSAVVAVTAAGRASLLRQGVEVPAGVTTQLGDLRLPEGATAEVVVRTATGEPVAGAEVVVAPLSTGIPAHIGERAGRTDADGRVVVPGLPRGRALAAARRSPKAPWAVGEPANADGELVVVLPGTGELLLTVLDPTAQVLRDVRLQLLDGAGNTGVVEFAMFGFRRGLDLGERLQRLDDGRLRVRDLPAGPLCVVVGAPGHNTAQLDVEIAGQVERTVTLRPARTLRVRALDAAGEPVRDARIYSQPRGGARPERIVDLPLPAGRTDDAGWCVVRDLPTEETRITAQHPRHGQVHAMVSGTPRELVLQFAAAGSIAGRLTDGGRPPAPGRWLLVLERRYDKQPRGAMPDLPQLQLPDLDGNFTFAALQPGLYRITAQDAVADVSTVGGMVQYMARRKQIYPWNKADVELLGGERLEVRLDAMVDTPAWVGPGAPVRGTVDIDGVPGEGALVVGTSTTPDRRVTSRVDRGGVFDLGHCPAGKLRVVVVPRDVAESRLLEHLFSHHFARDLVIVDGVPQQLAIAIATGSVAGEVRDWNGAPVDGCRVVLFDRGGEQRSSALRVERTDGRGRFRFAQLPAGSYELRAQRDGFGMVVVPAVDVVAGAEAGPVQVQLRATARVAGRVDVKALPRQGPIGLQLHPVGGGDVVRGGGRADGAFELKDVPVGRYRVELGVWGEPRRFRAGELEVVAPATVDVVLVPQPQ